jgi:hypothetical protein
MPNDKRPIWSQNDPKPKCASAVHFCVLGVLQLPSRPGQFKPERQREMMFEDFAVQGLHPVDRNEQRGG